MPAIIQIKVKVKVWLDKKYATSILKVRKTWIVKSKVYWPKIRQRIIISELMIVIFVNYYGTFSPAVRLENRLT